MTFTIIIRNLLHKPLGTFLSWILMLFGVAIISLILTMSKQLENKFVNDIADTDMVVGHKGSPLQLVLSAVYRADLPTGNIKESDLARIYTDPMIEQVIPLAYGDNYKGYSITGTDSNYLTKYKALFSKGRIFGSSMEAVLGSTVAENTNLMVGDSFLSAHGKSEKGAVHEGHPYKVTGILAPTNTVVDNLVLTNIETVRDIHDDHAAEQKTRSEHTNRIDQKKGHPEKISEGKHEEGDHAEEKEITAALIKFRSPMALMTFPRMINEMPGLQAASPALEMNRLMHLMGLGTMVIQYIAAAVMFIAMLSIFISLMNRLNERLYEAALLRSLGYTRLRLFIIVAGEGMLLTVAGFIAGIFLSRVGLYLLDRYAAKEYHIQFKLWHVSAEEGYLLLATLAAGFLAGLIPAIKAWKLNISKTLSNA